MDTAYGGENPDIREHVTEEAAPDLRELVRRPSFVLTEKAMTQGHEARSPHSYDTRNLYLQVKRGKLVWSGDVTRYDILLNTVFQGTLKGGRCRGAPKGWLTNVTEVVVLWRTCSLSPKTGMIDVTIKTGMRQACQLCAPPQRQVPVKGPMT